jgi:hypothetical protein
MPTHLHSSHHTCAHSRVLMTPHWPTDRALAILWFSRLNSIILWFFHLFLLWWTQPFCYSELGHSISHFATVDLVILSAILLRWTQPFCYSAHLFCEFVRHFATVNLAICYCELSHFTIVNSAILLLCTQSFCYCELSHCQLFCDFAVIFAIVNSTILIYWTQPFYDFVSHFITVNLTIFCNSELNHFATVTNHFMILLPFLRSCQSFLLQSSAFCKIAQSFSTFCHHSLEWLTWV